MLLATANAARPFPRPFGRDAHPGWTSREPRPRARCAQGRRGRARRALALGLDLLEIRAVPTTFTLISPTSPGPLQSPITPVGGIVIDLFGASGGRIEAELGPGELFGGAIDPGTTGLLGVKSGFTPSILQTLGGGLSAIAFRVTINGGATGPGNSARGQDVLLVNGLAIGDFSGVTTQQTSADGQTGLSMNAEGGFRSGVLDTGFFSSTDAGLLTRIYASIEATGTVGLQIQSTSPDPRALDFTSGLAPEIQSAADLPILAFNPPIITDVKVGSPINEGATATIDVSAFNLHTVKGGLTYQFDPRDDGSFSISTTTGSATIGFDRPGTYVVPIRVYNPDGARAVAQAVIVVENVAPTPQSPGDQNAVEGTVASLDLGTLTDPGRDAPWTVVVDWGDGSAATTFDASHIGSLGTADHVYAHPGSYAVGVHVTDAGGLSGVSTFTTTVANVAPAASSPGDQTAVEGSSADLRLGSFTDPGADGPWVVRVDWGDGSTAATFSLDRTGDLGTLAHLYAQAGTYPVAVSIVDLDGLGLGGASSFQVDVANLAPTIEPPGDQTTVEGTEANFDLGSLTDPGVDSPWTVHVTWSDGLDAQSWTVDRQGDFASLSRVFGVHGVYVATIEVTDALGMSGTSAFQVNVGDVAPEFDAVTFADALDVGQAGQLAATFHDPGFLDRFRVSIDWGDRTSTDLGGGLTARSYLASHAFTAPGTYEVVVTVVDLAGASASARLMVAVNGISSPTTPTRAGPILATPVLPALSNPSLGTLNFLSSSSSNSPLPSSPPPKGSIPVFPAFPGQGLGGNRPFSKMARKTNGGDGGRSLEEILADLLSARKAPIQVAAASTGSGVAFGGDLNAPVPSVGPKSSGVAGTGSVEPEALSRTLAANKRTRGKATRVMILVVAWTVSLRNQRRSSFSRRSDRLGRENARHGGRPS